MRLPETVYQDVLRGLGLQDNGLSDYLADAPSPDGAAMGPEASGGVPHGECKRRSRRRRLNHPVYFLRHGALNARPQPCTLLDTSRDGVCVLMDTVVAPGDQFVLYLPRVGEDGTTHPQPLAVLCTARSSRLKVGGKFRTGAEFTDAGSEEAQPSLAVRADGLAVRAKAPAGESGTARSGAGDAWLRMAGRLDADPDANARRSDRREADGRATIYMYRDDGQHGPVEQVALRDYSETGVGIVRSEPMAVGEQFVVRVPRLGETPITRLCRVVNVALAGERHRIGAVFIPFPGPNGRTFMSRLTSWIG